MLKPYDYVFSAGQAARNRSAKNLKGYEASERAQLIGSPQIDDSYPAPTQLNKNARTILHAPTWKSDRPSMNNARQMGAKPAPVGLCGFLGFVEARCPP